MTAQTNAIARLHDFGQSPWYDNLTRDLAEGGLRALVDTDGIRGVTSNPTIFEKAMAAGDSYDDQISQLARDGRPVDEMFWTLVVRDITDATGILAPVHESAGGGDGFVSVEVDPDLARDTEGTEAQVRSLWSRIDRPNLMVKIPATVEGLPAIERCIAAGININVTLIFSLARYDEVVDAYLRGLEQRVERGEDVSAIASVASFFVSRVDTETDRRLPDANELRGTAAVANAKLAYRLFQQRFAGERWERLEGAGARVQRPLWASTSTKNPDYSPTLYVDTLIGAHTVNTLAQPSVDVLRTRDAGELRADTVLERVDEAQARIAALADAGVDFDDVTATLEREGVHKFSQSYHDALATLGKKAEELGAG